MDPLAEMHLLLREHGWEPEVLLSRWKWSRPGWNFVFWTFALPPRQIHPGAVWEEIGPVGSILVTGDASATAAKCACHWVLRGIGIRHDCRHFWKESKK